MTIRASKGFAQSCAVIRPSGIDSALNTDILEAFIGRLQSAMEATEAKNGAKNSQWPQNGLTTN